MRSTIMLSSRFIGALLLALPLAAAAQTTPANQQKVTEVTEELDPATGKVIKRTTRTIMEPAGTTARPVTTTTNTAADVTSSVASDAVVSDYFREKTVVNQLTSRELLNAYTRFIEKVRADRRDWREADWANAASVLNSLNGRYEQLRASIVLDDKVTIRSQQAEFQALRTARQISKSVSDKL